jgi:sigma-B regulation protein RsbU (phosphoserine phosphatase)
MMKSHFNFWKITLLLLLGLFIFLYLFFNTVAEFYIAITNPAAGLHFHFDDSLGRIRIYDVITGGPADVAGLERGDEIIAVNNRPVASLRDFVHSLFDLKLGELAEIRALRGGAEIRMAFVSERWINTQLIFQTLLPAVLFGYSLCVIGTFVLLKRIQDREAHLFFLMVIFWALAMRSTFPQDYTLHNLLPSWFQDILLVPAWPLAIGLLLHFHLTFPAENKIYSRNRTLAKVIIYAPVVLMIPYLYGLVHELPWAGRVLNIGWGIWLSLYFLATLAVLRFSTNFDPDPHIRKQSEIMLKGTVVSLAIPMMIYFLPRLLFKKSFPYAEWTGQLVILWPLTLAYIIVKHRFMNIDVILKRGMAYALTSGVVVAAYYLLVVWFGRLVLYLTGARSQVVTILATLFIATIFTPVKNRVQNFVESRFHPSRFLFRAAVQVFSHKLVNVLDLKKLLHSLQSFFAETMRISPSVIFWLDSQTQQYVPHPNTAFGRLQFIGEDSVIKKLFVKQQLLNLADLTDDDTPGKSELAKWEALKTEMVMPLWSQGNLLGFLSIGPKPRREPYFKEELDLLESLSDRVNISLENALLTEELRQQDRLRKELEVARRIQTISLPRVDPVVPGLSVSGLSIPALEVGGDYYDYLTLTDGRFGVVVGDVAGKGTSAALYMSQLKGILNTASKYHSKLCDLAAEVNSVIYNDIDLQFFITLTIGAFDVHARKLHMVRAGHPPLIHYSARRQRCHELVPSGIGIGLEGGKIFKKQLREEIVSFNSGDVFVFYTDGVVESRNRKGEEFETEFLKNVLQASSHASAMELRDEIVAQVRSFSDNSNQKDDMTLVVVKAL